MDSEKSNLQFDSIVNEKLQQGVVDRAATLSFYLSVGFFLYGFTSTNFIHRFDASISEVNNILYRVLFNSIPSLLLGLYLKKWPTKSASSKAWVWVCVSPFIFMSACLINVWHIMLSINTQIYFYVHAANIMYINICCMLVSPSPKQIVALLSILITTIGIPIAWMLWHGHNSDTLEIFNLFVGDMALFMVLSGVCGYSNFRLRKLVIIESSELDVTVHKLKNAQSTLIEAEKSRTLGTFASGLAHELLNNLNYVFNSIPLVNKRVNTIVDEADRMKVQEALQRIELGVSKSIEVCKGFKIYSGNETFQPKEIDIKRTIISAIRMLNHIADERQIKLLVKVEDGLTVYGNESGFHQIFINLISNALDATKGGGTVALNAFSQNNCCTIEISDNGVGIPIEIRSRIYDPFFTTKDVGKGTGLGLSIVKGTLEKYGGSIKLQSEVGKGTVFTITLPPFNNEEKV